MTKQEVHRCVLAADIAISEVLREYGKRLPPRVYTLLVRALLLVRQCSPPMGYEASRG
jgi:hypothetical protein